MAAPETIVPLPCAPRAVIAAREIRSTTLVSSRNALRAAGLESAYLSYLSESDIQQLHALVPGSWVSMRLALAHYAAVDQLGLSDEVARANGRRVAEFVQNAHVVTLLRAVGSAVPIWMVIGRCPTLMSRLVKGGACAVYKLGPKDARIELHGVPIARYAYVRAGWAGMIEGTLSMVARGVTVRDRSRINSDTIAAFGVSWS